MFNRIDISKEGWKEISAVLAKYKIPYTTHYEEITGEMEYSDKVITNKHIQIHLVLRDYFEEGLE
jgi:hypothetical protein